MGPDAVEIREQIQHNDQGPKSLNMESASSDTLGNAYFAATESGELWTYRTGRFFPVLAQKDMKPVRGLEAITCTPEGTVWAINTEMGLMELAVSRRKTQYVATVLQAIPLDSSKYWGYKKILIDKEKCIWLSTSRQKGILLFRPAANGRYTRSGSIRPEQLSSEMVRDMAADGNGNVYVGTNAGIDKVTALNNGAFQIRKGIFNNYLTGTYVYYLRISGNYLFVGTTGSIAQIRLSKFKQVKEAPAVYITGLRVNNAGLDTLLNEAGKTACFKASENTLNFTFLSPSYTNEKEIRYKYYLEGVDQQWSEPDYNFTTTYSQLKPGKYKFQVLAQNADGIWSEQPAAFAFVIRQPFYGQWWFIALMTLAIAAFLYWLYRIRIARVLAVERTRQRISKDLHDDIGSTLSSITLMNALLRKKIGTHPEEASELAGKVEETSREMIQNISDIVWSTNPGNDSIEKLQFRLQQFAGDLFEPLNISYAIHFDREIVKKELSMDLKRDLYLVIKEIMNNAAKYSRATHFNLAISATRDTLRVLASDNGIGFDTAGTVKGNGLLNIRQRVQRFQGKITLTSRAGKGTDWEFLIPL
ncbi:MAG: hypothetical protein JNL13_10440 [Chitinophagaceae bacterium]|nr:hypothetical protein [Chitinophagaceae bacterium]